MRLNEETVCKGFSLLRCAESLVEDRLGLELLQSKASRHPTREGNSPAGLGRRPGGTKNGNGPRDDTTTNRDAAHTKRPPQRYISVLGFFDFGWAWNS